MKRADLHTGVVYALQEGTYDVTPVIILDTKTLWTMGSRRDPAARPKENATRPTSRGYLGEYEPIGYPAYVLQRDFRSDLDMAMLSDSRLTLKNFPEMAARKIDKTGIEWVLPVVIDPRRLRGEWAEVAAKRAAERQAKEGRNARLKAEAAELVAAAHTRRDRLAALGIEVPKPELGYSPDNIGTQWETFGTRSLELSATEIDRLLDLAEKGAL